MKLPSPFLLRWGAVGIAVVWLLLILGSNFLDAAPGSGVVTAFSEATVNGPPQTRWMTAAECARLQAEWRPYSGSGFPFCKEGPYQTPLFTVSLRLLTAVALVAGAGLLFLAALSNRRGSNSN